MKVFVASNMPTDYPWKLQKPSTVSDRIRETASEYILDSGIGDDVTTGELIELSREYEPDYLVAKDELNEHDTTIENTVEILDRDYCGELLVPLQPPYDEHYRKLEAIGVTDEKYVLGGMAVKEVDTATQLRWINDFREVAPDAYAHGLGVGGGIKFVEACARNDLLQSVDCATPEMAAINGAVLDTRLRQQEVMAFDGGTGRSKRSYALAEFNSWNLHDVWTNEEQMAHNLTSYA